MHTPGPPNPYSPYTQQQPQAQPPFPPYPQLPQERAAQQKQAPNVLYWVLALLGVGFVAMVGLFFAFVVFQGYVAMKTASAPLSPPTSAPAARPSPSAFGGGVADEDDDEETDDDEPTLNSSKLPAIKRDVPHHDVKILSGCSEADLRAVLDQIDDAVQTGAPRYNRGDFQGCYDTYVRTAKDIEAELPKTCAGPAAALKAGRDKASKLASSSERAWAMRDAFDGLIDVIERRGPSL